MGRHMSAEQAQKDEQHSYSHETRGVKSEMASLHIGKDQKTVHMSAKQLRSDVQNYFDSEVKTVMAAHAPHPMRAPVRSAPEAAKSIKAAAEKRLAQKHQEALSQQHPEG